MACVNDIIVAVGAMDDLDLARLGPETRLVDATGCVVMLGLVFGGNRAHEVERKPRGASCGAKAASIFWPAAGAF